MLVLELVIDSSSVRGLHWLSTYELVLFIQVTTSTRAFHVLFLTSVIEYLKVHENPIEIKKTNQSSFCHTVLFISKHPCLDVRDVFLLWPSLCKITSVGIFFFLKVSA